MNRHQIVPLGAASRKRKDREASFQSFKRPSQPVTPSNTTPSNRLILAGYMAHEFLTKGTLLGQKWDPVRAPVEPQKPKPKPGAESVEHVSSYTDVAFLLKGDGAHIPGIVNPTQLARWIQM